MLRISHILPFYRFLHFKHLKRREKRRTKQITVCSEADCPVSILSCVMHVMQIQALDSRYKLSESKDYEVKVSFLKRAISCGCKAYYSEVEKTLKGVGRMKYLRPLYTALVKGGAKEDDKVFAKRIFSEARESYHPIAQGVVEAIFAKHL